MATVANARTVGELKKLLASLGDDLPIGISYSEDDGLGEILVVMTDPEHTKAKFWIGMDAFETDGKVTEGEEDEDA